MNSAGDCPSQKILRQFAYRQLDETVRAEVAEHLAKCEACSQSLAQLMISLVSPGEGGTVVDSKPTTTPLASPREGLSETKSAMCGDPSSLDDIELDYLLPSGNPQALGRIANYDVLGVVGRGGMGVVLKAFDESLHRIVAIKVLAPELASSAKARRRFVREARAAAAVNHPNVITIHAVDEQGGMPYLVMEYIAGCTLRERINRSPPLEPLDVMRIGAQIASGLAAAHEQGVIHRDIKPSNVMLEDGLERVKIADFGLARAAMDLADITSLGHAVGTPSYVSPEQVTGKDVDVRSDLFSLGCLLHALLTGHSPFRGRLVLEVIRQVAEHDPPNLAKVNPRVPRHLADLIQKLLQKNPDDRFQSAREVAALLNREIAIANQMPSDKLPRLGMSPPQRRVRGPLVVTALLGISAVLAGFFIWRPWRSRSDGESPAPRSVAPAAVTRLTVAHDGHGNYRTISEALEHAGRGTVIEVVDDGPYDEAIKIDNATRLEGVSLVSADRTLLTAPAGPRAVIHIAAPGITVRGFRFEPLSEQHAVWISGQAEDVSVQDVRSNKNDGSDWAHVLLSDGAHGSEGRPIEIRDSSFHGGTLGIILLGAMEAPLKSIRIEQNEFHGPGKHLELLQSLSDVRVRGNVFVGGYGAFVSLEVADGSHDIRLTNNTFLKTSPWLGLGGSQPSQRNVAISNNLILGSDHVEVDDLDRFATWSFDHNWSEPPPGKEEKATRVAVRKPNIDLISRDPESPDFLRPRHDSDLSTSGAGGELPNYIGARPSRD
jgi:serine/threonine protein kinase